MAKNKQLRPVNTEVATQSNKLIEAAYMMSVPAKRVMLLLIAQLHPGQRDITEKVTIHAEAYAKATGVNSTQAYNDIKKGCRELMRTIIVTKNNHEQTTEECVVVQWMKYHKNEGWLEATFTQWIAPFLHQLKSEYTTIEINEALKFSRFYTVRLYELLMQFQRTGERHITVVDLRRVFEIEEPKYRKFSEFNRWVLSPSITEIENKTPLDVAWEPIKTGRKITSVSFLFDERVQADMFKG